MIDNYKSAKGFIKVETIDKNGNTVDTFENRNLIMDTASDIMSELVCNTSTAPGLTKFVLGVDGHVGGDYLVAKPAGLNTDGDYPNSEKYYSERTKLFSEQNAIDTPGVDDYTYPITFDPTGSNGFQPVLIEGSGGDVLTGGATVSTVDLTQSGNNTTYVISIPTEVANSSGNAVYTEAALYSDTRIFSMKTFIGKIKDNTVSLRVTWTISF